MQITHEQVTASRKSINSTAIGLVDALYKSIDYFEHLDVDNVQSKDLMLEGISPLAAAVAAAADFQVLVGWNKTMSALSAAASDGAVDSQAVLDSMTKVLATRLITFDAAGQSAFGRLYSGMVSNGYAQLIQQGLLAQDADKMVRGICADIGPDAYDRLVAKDPEVTEAVHAGIKAKAMERLRETIAKRAGQGPDANGILAALLGSAAEGVQVFEVKDTDDESPDEAPSPFAHAGHVNFGVGGGSGGGNSGDRYLGRAHES